MIPTTTANSISTNTTNSTQFQIADSSVLVELLSSKLYTNKINSFIREIGCNALDANAASKSSEPITIEIGKDGQTLTVEIGDTGPGMSPETIRAKLAVLGVSTKSDDNLSIGGYGIGFLTTLAVSRRIEIHSDCQGICYHYKITEESGQLAIYLVSSSPSVSPTSGTIVKTWFDRSSASLTEITRELRYAIASFAYQLTPTPIVSCRDRYLYGATEFSAEVRNFKSSLVSSNSRYAWHLPNPSGFDRDNSTMKKYLIDRPRFTIVLLGPVAYAVSAGFMMQGFNAWWAPHKKEDSILSPKMLDLKVFIEASRYLTLNPDYANYTNCLFLKFEIGELEVNTSRESLAQTAANASKIFDRLLVVLPHLAQAVQARLVHSVSNRGVFGNRINDYFQVAHSWSLPTVKLNNTDIALIDLPEADPLPKFWSVWAGEKVKGGGWDYQDCCLDRVFTGRTEITVIELLGLLMKIDLRFDRAHLIIVVGARDNSSPRLRAKFVPEDIDVHRVVLFKVDFLSEAEEILTNYPWLRDFAEVDIREVVPVAAKFAANTSVNNALLWADLRDEETCPVFQAARWSEYIVRDERLPKLNISAFKRSNPLNVPIYYFTPSQLGVTSGLVDRFIQSLDRLGLELDEFYIMGDRTVEHLASLGYDLHPAWDLVLPAINRWIESQLVPTVEKLGYLPGYHTAMTPTPEAKIERRRVGFVASSRVSAFIDPSRVWLATWLGREYETLHLVTQALPILIQRTCDCDSSQGQFQIYHEYLVEFRIKSETAIDGTRYHDRLLNSSMKYLFHDVLEAFPILTTSWGIWSDKAFYESEEYAIDLWSKEIESGCLKKWRNKV